MTDNVRKIFNVLGIEPNQKFKIKDVDNMTSGIFHMDENLNVLDKEGRVYSLKLLLNGTYKIIKFPKKKKLRDLTPEELSKWKDNNCPYSNCGQCIFRYLSCTVLCSEDSWINNKDLFSDKFLDQEIEVED